MRIMSPGLALFDLVLSHRALIMTAATTLIVIIILAVMALLLPANHTEHSPDHHTKISLKR